MIYNLYTSPPVVNAAALNRGGYNIVNHILIELQTGTTVCVVPVFLFGMMTHLIFTNLLFAL